MSLPVADPPDHWRRSKALNAREFRRSCDHFFSSFFCILHTGKTAKFPTVEGTGLPTVSTFSISGMASHACT